MKELSPKTQTEHFKALHKTIAKMLKQHDYGHQTEFLDRMSDQCDYALAQLQEIEAEEEKELADEDE